MTYMENNPKFRHYGQFFFLNQPTNYKLLIVVNTSVCNSRFHVISDTFDNTLALYKCYAQDNEQDQRK